MLCSKVRLYVSNEFLEVVQEWKETFTWVVLNKDSRSDQANVVAADVKRFTNRDTRYYVLPTFVEFDTTVVYVVDHIATCGITSKRSGRRCANKSN